MGRDRIAGIISASSLIAMGAPCLAAPVMSTKPVVAPVTPPAEGLTVFDVTMKMRFASQRVSRVVGHPVTFDAPDINPTSFKLVAEAAERAAQAFEDSTLVLNGREKTMAITKVLIVEGDRADLRLQGEVLRITVAAREMAAPPPERIFHLLATQATA